MSESTNVIAAQYDLRVQRGADFEIYFQAADADEQKIDWNNVIEVKIDVKNQVGKVVASFAVGNGLTVDDADTTRLLLRKGANEKNLPAGSYDWDLKVKFSEDSVQYPVRGKYISVDYITA